MFKILETFKKIEKKQFERYYQNFIKKGLTPEEAEQKADKKVKTDKFIIYMFIAYILISIFGGSFSAK